MDKKYNPELMKKEVKALISEIIEIPIDEIKEESEFVKDLGIDSMMALEIVASLEKKYRVVIPEEKIPSIRSLKNVYELLEERLKK